MIFRCDKNFLFLVYVMVVIYIKIIKKEKVDGSFVCIVGWKFFLIIL